MNQPPPTADKPQSAGHLTEGGNQTTQEMPNPRANARDDHDPAANPPKQRDEERDGIRPGGQGELGKETQRPPLIAIERMQAIERAAKAPRPEKPTSETENTRARGQRERTTESTPRAQPTEIGTESGTAAIAAEIAATGAEDREPEKPTAEASESMETITEGRGIRKSLL
jgi:hypothetical protein